MNTAEALKSAVRVAHFARDWPNHATFINAIRDAVADSDLTVLEQAAILQQFATVLLEGASGT